MAPCAPAEVCGTLEYEHHDRLPVPSDDLLRVAVAAYLARYQGLSRTHTDSDPRVYLGWCADRGLDPLAARRVDVELYVRWLQEQPPSWLPVPEDARKHSTMRVCAHCDLDGAEPRGALVDPVDRLP